MASSVQLGCDDYTMRREPTAFGRNFEESRSRLMEQHELMHPLLWALWLGWMGYPARTAQNSSLLADSVDRHLISLHIFLPRLNGVSR